MELIKPCIDIFLHLDRHLAQVIDVCGLWTYGVLFVIVFCETGLVVTPFLPGDSLLFAAGALTVSSSLQILWLWPLLTVAAIAGDAVNYAVGYYAGERLLRSKIRVVRKEHLDRTHRFFEKHGRMTIVLARFVPIVRTFAPFVAGLGKMRYVEFAIYNVTGGIMWVSLFVLGGHFFGNIPVVKRNFSLMVVGIIVVSVLPIVFEVWKQWREKKRTDSE